MARAAQPIIAARGLVKRFGATVALDGLDLAVPSGSVFGLLGPNGAGKTTAVRILATLVRPDGGDVRIGGYDPVQQPAQVRELIGLTGQYAALDGFQSGRANLIMLGRLSGLPHKRAKARASDLLERFGITEAADRVVSGYSGGMRRRLDLAASLLAAPAVLFLDEPTTGLDPASRIGLWDIVREIVSRGTTVLLTTQYLEEADQVAEKIAVIDHGKVIAEGTSNELKSAIGATELVLTIAKDSDLVEASDLLGRSGFAQGPARIDSESRELRILAKEQPQLVSQLIATLSQTGVHVDAMTTRQPSLDQVFLTLTGKVAASGVESEATPSGDGPPRKEAV